MQNIERQTMRINIGIRQIYHAMKAALTRSEGPINPVKSEAVEPSSPEELFSLERHSPIVTLLVDGDRRVRSMNDAGQEFTGLTESEATGLRAGRAFQCIHAADSPKGCGYGEACESCVVRNAVIDTLETDRPHRQEEATMRFCAGGENVSEVHVLVSTCPVEVEGDRRVAVWLEDVSSLKQAQEQLAELARTDPLTGLPNRRQITEDLNRELAESERHGFPLAVAMIDVDRFKLVNDNLGHDTGDALLQKLAQLLENGVRTGDIIGRYGGDEFVIIFPHTELSDAHGTAERVRGKYADWDDPGENCRTTLSIGLATIQPGDTAPTILKRADKNMYEAKSRGKDCTVVRTAES